MKKQGKIITLFGLFALSLVTSGVLLNAQSNNEHAVAETESVTVYLKPNANWLADNARFAVYWFDNTSNGWYDMYNFVEEGFESGYYYSTLDLSDAANTTLIFCRMNPSALENNWDNKWNQTANMPFSSGNNVCVIQDNWWDGGGEWKGTILQQSDETYDVYLRVVPLAPYETGISFDFSYDGENGVTPNIHYWTSNATTVGASVFPGVPMTQVDGETNLYKATISQTFDSVLFTAVSGDGRINKTEDLYSLSILPAYTEDRIVGYSVGGDAKYESSDWSNEFVYGGSWSTISQPVINDDIYTLWLNRNNNWASDYTYVYHFWNDTGVDFEVYPREYIEFYGVDTSTYLVRYDLPSIIVGLNAQFKIYDIKGKFVESTDIVVYNDGDNSGVATITVVDGSGVFLNLRQKYYITDVMSAQIVLSNYFTCSPDANNGYGAFSDVVTNWNLAEGIFEKEDYRDVDIDDYAYNNGDYQSDYNSGNKTTKTSLKEKYETMLSLYNANVASSASLLVKLDSNNIQSIILFVSVSMSIAVLISVVAIYNKKRNLNSK